ncbi:MAG TPA: DUF1871 domain-containing protein [Clostridiales bacterium]|nr:DUF1871 domain-containing protein [Clostridiales bacterium]
MLMKVRKIINEFDPLGLLPYAPPDEYEGEIRGIILFLEDNKGCDLAVLANQIFETFKRTLGVDAFRKSIEDCRQVAYKILSR